MRLSADLWFRPMYLRETAGGGFLLSSHRQLTAWMNEGFKNAASFFYESGFCTQSPVGGAVKSASRAQHRLGHIFSDSTSQVSKYALDLSPWHLSCETNPYFYIRA